MDQKLVLDLYIILVNNPKQPSHARDSFKSKNYQKALKNVTLFFLSNPVPFNGQNCKKRKEPGTRDQSFFRLQNKFRTIPLLVVYCLTKFWWCKIKRFLSYSKIASANLCKPIHDIIKYSTSIYPFETEKCRKEGKNYKNLNISRSKRCFLDEIKTSFHKFWSAIIWWKNKNLIKNSGNKP